MKISVVGTGYVGLVTGACFADNGNQVYCIDKLTSKVESLKSGEVPFFEPGLNTLVQRNVRGKRLLFTDDLKQAVEASNIHFICVGTPFDESQNTLDTNNLVKVAELVSEHAAEGDLLVIKSTVPVGTARRVRQAIANVTKKELHVVSNPEFLKEGNAVEDFMKPDRIVVGVADEEGEPAKLMTKLYQSYVRTGNPILIMDNTSAEMVKLASNGYLATRISYMNEIANLCELSGADVTRVRKGMGLDSRIGHRYLFPGAGYGGSCFPKDIQALMHLGTSYPFGARILTSVHQVNQQQRQNFVEKIRHSVGGELANKTVAIWGLAFKANTDDIRDAPSMDVIAALLEKGARLQVYDPEAMENVQAVFGDKLHYCSDNYECLNDADALCVLTEWGVFRNPDFDRIKKNMRQAVIVDGRNLYNAKDLSARGFKYFFVGQPYAGKQA